MLGISFAFGGAVSSRNTNALPSPRLTHPLSFANSSNSFPLFTLKSLAASFVLRCLYARSMHAAISSRTVALSMVMKCA